MVSIKVKRNIAVFLCIIGILCLCIRLWSVITVPNSGKAWFELAGMAVLTYFCFDRLLGYQHRLKENH